MGEAERAIRVWVVGCGTVGRWLLASLHSGRARLADRHGVSVRVVGLANRRDGFVHDERGIDIGSVLDLLAAGRSIAEQPGTRRWDSAGEGLAATEADLLVEVTASPSGDGEPGVSHMRAALERGIPVVTSNKWPVALHGLELARLARGRGVAFRAESTVMSGTPVLGPLVEGLAGTTPTGVRGVLNATVNFMLTAMARGASYEDALEQARGAGLAERDVGADVDGHDSQAKLMILAALVFGRQLARQEVRRKGIADVDPAAIERAVSAGARICHLATLELSDPEGGGILTARVEPELLAADDPLARVEGTDNAVVCRAEPIGEITIVGPGAGLELAGQGVLSDLIAVASRRRTPAARPARPAG